MEGTFQFVLCSTDITNHKIIAGIYHIGYPIENPERRIPGESNIIGPTYAGITYWNFIRTTIYRSENCHIRIIRTKPEHSTHCIGHTGTHLCHKYKTTLLGRNRTLIEIFLTIYLEIQRRETIRGFIRAGTKIIANIERSPLIMITHCILHILHGDFTIRFYKQWHGIIRLTLYIGKECLTLICEHIEITPHTGLTKAACTKIKRSIGIGKTKIFIHTAEVSFLAGKRNHIRRIETILFIIHIKLMDARLVGMCRNTIIGHADSYPYSSTDSGAFTYQFHDPYFIRIGNSERLSATIIPILLHEICHNLDSLTRRTRTLQTDINQASIIDDTGRIGKFGTSAKSCFTDSHLKLIHITNDIVGLACLFNLSEIFTGIPLIDIEQSSLLIGSSRIVV